FGNHFLDSFSEYRENLRKAQKRTGRTLSINWPLWEEGGMDMSQDQIAVLEKQIGISPLPVEEGIHYWEDCLRSELLQAVALYGIPSKIAAAIDQKPATVHISAPAPVERVSANILMEQTEAYLKVLVGQQIQLDPDRIGLSDRFESFGIDSVMIA